MAKLEYSLDAITDIDRLVNFLMGFDLAAALDTYGIINDGLQLLKRHPKIGRIVTGEKRELAISRGSTGYVAVYTFDNLLDVVIVLAIKRQRESDFN